MKDKKTKLSEQERNDLLHRLDGLMYRKAAIEKDVDARLKAANVYSRYLDTAGDMPNDAETELKLYETVIKAREHISVYKELKSEYIDHIIPMITEVCGKLGIDVTGNEVVDFEKKAKELVVEEHLENVEIIPANTEIPLLIDAYHQMIAASDRIIQALKEVVSLTPEDEMRLVTEQMRNAVLKRRLKAREEYWNNTFFPQYKKDMAEAEKYLGSYLKRAGDIAQTGIDVKLSAMLDQWQAHKNDPEMKWLFYTTLKKRVDEIRDHILLNKDRMKPFIHLSNPIIDVPVQQENSSIASKGKVEKKRRSIAASKR